MNIRNKILLFFSVISILLMGVALLFIYTIFSEYRVEEYQKRQKEKITTTLKFLSKIKQSDHDILEAIDEISIHQLHDEKLLIFNKNKEIIYASIDDIPIPFSRTLLNELSAKKPLIEKKEGLYDIVGIRIGTASNTYYGISKAYDTFGYAKLHYLKYVLISTYIGFSIIIIFVSYYLSKKITQPIINITQKINTYNIESAYVPIEIPSSKDELTVLAQQFNTLMKKMNEVFSFQKHAIHHISHELKTPIAILVSNFERIEKETDIEIIKSFINNQKQDTKNLGEIINSLLEIAKAESGNDLPVHKIRIDELLFDIAEELQNLHPTFQFLIEYEQTEDENKLLVTANSRLLKAGLTNLMVNAIQYSNDQKAKVLISNYDYNLQLQIINNGPIIEDRENLFLFQHFFRGANSKGKRGFGLGLVFTHKIIKLHGGHVLYSAPNSNLNKFIVTIPLS